MQFSDMLKITKDRNLKWAEYAVKGSVLFLVAIFLGHEIISEKGFEAFDSNLIGQIGQVIPIIVVMCILNWCLEAAKWHVLANSVTNLSYAESLKGVFSGLALSRIVPGGIGECFGRMGYLNTSHRVEAGALVYLGGAIQFFITVIFGSYGVAHFAKAKFTIMPFVAILIALALIATIFLFIFFKIDFGLGSRFSRGFFRIKSALQLLTFTTFVKFTFLGILRYLVFGLQLYLLFHTMNLGIQPHLIIAGITLIYLTKTIIPTFNFLGDLGIRELSAIYFFSQFSVHSNLVVLPTLVLWLINILLPSLLGLYFIARARIFSLQPEIVK